MKYIIEFEDEPTAYEDGMTFYACKQSPYWSMNKGQLNRLTPYTEPNLNPLVDEAVETIENEVWEFVCKFVWAIDDKKILGTDILHAVRDMTYQDAKAKYESWKAEKDEIRVGDEVKHRGLNYVVGYVGADKVYHLIDKNWLRTVVQGGYQLIKTGRHFPEVAELLKKMRDTE